jgi:hypothetical protein
MNKTDEIMHMEKYILAQRHIKIQTVTQEVGLVKLTMHEIVWATSLDFKKRVCWVPEQLKELYRTRVILPAVVDVLL